MAEGINTGKLGVVNPIFFVDENDGNKLGKSVTSFAQPTPVTINYSKQGSVTINYSKQRLPLTETPLRQKHVSHHKSPSIDLSRPPPLNLVYPVDENLSIDSSHSPSLNFIYPEPQTKQHITRQWLKEVCQKIEEKLDQQANEIQISPMFIITKKMKLAHILSAKNTLIRKILPELVPANSEFLSLSEIKYLSIKLQHIVKKLPQSTVQEILKLVVEQLISEWSLISKHQLYEAKVEELSFLSTPGSAKQVGKGLGFAVGTSIAPLLGISKPLGPFLEAEVGYNSKIKRRVNDENKVYKEKFSTPYIAASAGCNWDIPMVSQTGISGNLKGEHTKIKWKKWKNVRHYVYSKGQKICWDNRQDNTKAKSSTKVKLKIQKTLSLSNELKHHKKYQESAQNGQHRLNELVETYLALKNHNISAPQNIRVKPIKGKTYTYSGQMTVSGGLQATLGEPLGVKLGIKATGIHKIERTRKHEYDPKYIWEHIENIPVVCLPEVNAQLSENISRHNIITALQALDTNFAKYTENVQKYDYSKTNSSFKQEKAQLKTIKHNLENEFGLIGRHDFIKHTSLKLCALAKAIEAIEAIEGINVNTDRHDNDHQTIKDLISKLGRQISNPAFTYSKSKLDKIICVNRYILKSYVDNTSTINLNSPVFSGQIEIFNRWRDHPNRFRAGQYRDVTISGFINPSLQHKMSGADLATVIKDIAKSLGHQIEIDFNIFPDVGITAEVSYRTRDFKPQFTQEPNYAGDRSWQRMWTRRILDGGVNLDLNTRFTVQTGVHLGPHFTYKNLVTEIQKETLGTHCLIYLAMMFNRYYTDSSCTANNQMWLKFRQQHEKELKQILVNLQQKDKCLIETLESWRQELLEFEKNNQSHQSHQIVTNVAAAFINLDSTLTTFAENKNEVNYKNAMANLEHILTLLSVPLKMEYEKPWIIGEYKNKSAQHKSTQALIKLGMHSRFKLMFSNENENENENEMKDKYQPRYNVNLLNLIQLYFYNEISAY